MPKVKANSQAAKPRSQRELLSQLKALVSLAGNEKKFLLAYMELNIENVGRTTVYDAFRGKTAIGPKLTGLLDRIKSATEQADLETELYSKPETGHKTPKKSRVSSVASASDSTNGGNSAKVKKTRATKSKYELTRSVLDYVTQLQMLIAASGSERKFFSQYERFNVANAVRSTVYTAIHDGVVRVALGQMLDKINEQKAKDKRDGAAIASSRSQPRPEIEEIPNDSR